MKKLQKFENLIENFMNEDEGSLDHLKDSFDSILELMLVDDELSDEEREELVKSHKDSLMDLLKACYDANYHEWDEVVAHLSGEESEEDDSEDASEDDVADDSEEDEVEESSEILSDDAETTEESELSEEETKEEE